jgi:glycogen operon protein
MVGAFASRICGSADIYAKSGKGPEASINFVTCHDGFTLNDLVSYRDKHNEANGDGNHDGTDHNLSDNYGVEGETTDARVEAVRRGQIKNFLLTLLVSRGVPMLLGGDEFRRTQDGNNNAYCQDNETSWHDWGCLERHKDIFRFTQGMVAFRRAHPILSKEQFYTEAEIRWFGPRGGLPNWADPKEKQLACLIHEDEKHALWLMFNAGAETIDFSLPGLPPGDRWYRAADTGRQVPQDLFPAGQEPLWEDPQAYLLSPRSSAILLVRQAPGTEGK